jgi:hypothetical protein
MEIKLLCHISFPLKNMGNKSIVSCSVIIDAEFDKEDHNLISPILLGLMH